MPADLLAMIAALYDRQAELFNDRLRYEGITWSEFQILSIVHSEKGPCWQADVARKLGISPPSLTETVQALVARDLIEQKSSEADRRVKMLILTPSSMAILENLRKFHKGMSESVCKGIPREHQSVAESVMRTISGNLDAIAHQ